MAQFLADEDFNGRIVRGLLRRRNDFDIVRAQDVGLTSAPDDVILQWATERNRVLLTHDARTMPRHACARLASGQHIAGMFVVDDLAPIGACLEDILLLDGVSAEGEWQDRIFYLPLS
ncbi:MAG: DUF5615 family PIN-like protein [Pirellulales bacterium]|nr:DUF5615 family PIN-like protein [Pirellulales bacterium]